MPNRYPEHYSTVLPSSGSGKTFEMGLEGEFLLDAKIHSWRDAVVEVPRLFFWERQKSQA